MSGNAEHEERTRTQHEAAAEGRPLLGPSVGGGDRENAATRPRKAGKRGRADNVGSGTAGFWAGLRWPLRLFPVGRIRGRVHRVSRIGTGEVSVVLRFGMEEDANLIPGTLVEVTVLRERTPSKVGP